MTVLSKTIPGILLDINRNNEGNNDRDISHGETSSNDDQGSSSHASSSKTKSESSRTLTTDDETNLIKEELARHETTNVFRLRIVVIVILVTVAAAVAYLIHHITYTAEIAAFITEFEGNADMIIASLNDIVDSMSAIAGFAVTISVEAEVWPFVTLSAYHMRARNVEGADYITLNPIVQAADLAAWESYVQTPVNAWIAEGLTIQQEQGLNDFDDPGVTRKSFLTNKTVDPLHTFNEAGQPLLSKSTGPYFVPRWQMFPVLETSMVNENLLENPKVSKTVQASIERRSAVMSGFHFAPAGGPSDPDITTAFFATLESMTFGKQMEYGGDPMSHIAIPIFDSLNGTDRGEVVGVLKAKFHWKDHLEGILPATDYGYHVIVENGCDPIGHNAFTYQVDGPKVKVLGKGNRHDPKFTQYHVVENFAKDIIQDGTLQGLNYFDNFCPYVFHVHPTQAHYDKYVTNVPIILSLSMAVVFLFTIGMFLLYDRLVERRQSIVLAQATQSTAIVSSLFPKQVRDRLLAIETAKDNRRKGDAMITNSFKLKSFLNGPGDKSMHHDQPIADFFPYCTVMFADIAGFTAWSSAREPAQVFILLQAVYQSFDIIAKKRKVFKVETIGDSYIAVTGLPEPQTKHASIMARFAWDCLTRIGEVTKELESTLGPDTEALSMRFGLHSGAVTAGVLKGDRARFQLFGDTVNTAARMESTGMKGRIQVSHTTAEELKKEKKGSWLSPRSDNVVAKGKGVMSTYWLALDKNGQSLSSYEDAATIGNTVPRGSCRAASFLDQKDARVVDWVCEILIKQIKQVVVVHQKCRLPTHSNRNVEFQGQVGKICLDEVLEAIRTPDFNAEVAEAILDYGLVQVPESISNDIRDYVVMIASSYNCNKFHNFEHACHVTMSVAKLLGRVASPEFSSIQEESVTDERARNHLAAQVHDFTHGLTSDPLAKLALVFTALIHDVDHLGISNVQLAKEQPELAAYYRNKSVAEQNSLDIAWDLLMTDRFKKLREYIFETQAELLRFRQLIVNMVLATDIFDNDFNQLRKVRWQRAFHENLPDSVTKDLRATIVMEHIIQASDVSHTMQHWHIYQKWNRRLFEEMYTAYQAGRLGSDPRTFWYKGELAFFDNYVIPLATKLKECNVFGVSSDEYLDYAMKNREEWAERGEEIVATMIAQLQES